MNKVNWIRVIVCAAVLCGLALVVTSDAQVKVLQAETQATRALVKYEQAKLDKVLCEVCELRGRIAAYSEIRRANAEK